MAYRLTDTDIDRASEEVAAFLNKNAVTQERIIKTRLGVEEALIGFKQQLGEVPFILKTGKIFGKITISVSVKGPMYDPFARTEDDYSDSLFLRNALFSAGALPVWRYGGGANTVVISFSTREIPEWTRLIIAVACAVILWLVLKLFPNDLNYLLHTHIVSPILDKFYGILGAMAGPMVFLSIVWGIYSIGDIAVFNTLGKKLLIRYMLYLAAMTIGIFLIAIPFFSLALTGNAAGNDYSTLFHMVLDIIPENLFTPFSRGNTLQILFVAVFMGLAMIYIAEKTQTIAIVAEQLNYLVQVVISCIGKMVPFFIFGSIYDILASGQIDMISLSYKLFLSNLAGCIIIAAILTAVVCIRTNTKVRVLLKKAFKTAIICITTASSAAAFGTSVETCEKRYGIRNKLVNFGVPFGQVIFKPSLAVLYALSAICLAEYFHVDISISWAITAVIVSVVLAVATPPIPGSASASFTVLFSQLGIPADGIAIVLAVSIILDFFETTVDMYGGQCMLILEAEKFDMLDIETLRNENK